jgi:hypothetical protein
VVGPCEDGNELSISLKDREFLDLSELLTASHKGFFFMQL